MEVLGSHTVSYKSYCRHADRLIAVDTSKVGSLVPAHGRNGTFLSSLAALSILTVTSHHQGHRSQNTLILHHSRQAARLVPAPAHHHLSNHDHGTRVTVQDLFGNMPVRIKQRAIDRSDGRDDTKEWDVLKRCIVGLLLAWHSATAISIRDITMTRRLYIRGTATASESMDSAIKCPPKTNSFDLNTIGNVLSQAAYIETPNLDAWVKTSARTLLMTIRGAFSLVPAPTKHVQFLSLGMRPLHPENGGNILYDEINRIFSASSFGVLEDLSDTNEKTGDRKFKDRRYKQDGFTNKQLKSGGKGVDRWPMFYIRIELQDASHLQYRGEEGSLEGGSILSAVIEVLSAMTTGFLKQHHFRPRARRLKNYLARSEDPRSPSSLSRSRPISKRSASDVNIPSRDADKGVESISRHLSRPSTQSVESEAESIARRPKFSTRKDLPSSIDTFGSHVKLPNFSRRRSYHSGGGLDGWSRIKGGKRNASEDIRSKLERIKRVTEIANSVPVHILEGDELPIAMNDGPAPEDAARSPGSALCDQDANTGISFNALMEDTTTSQCDSSVGASAHYATIAESPNSVEGDCEPEIAIEETVSWTNPTSKERVLISTRTGLVVHRSSKQLSSVSIDPEKPGESRYRQTQWPRKRTKISRRLSDPFVAPKEGSWVGDCLGSWENPIFRPAEENIPQVSFEGPTLDASTVLHGRNHRCSHWDIENAFRESSTSFSAKLSKAGLNSAEVIAQVDKKFILVKMRMDYEIVSSSEDEPSVLVLIDQHAADERMRVEGLLHDLCRPPATCLSSPRSSLGYTSGVAITLLSKPITVQIPAREHALFVTHAAHFANWGILYNITPPQTGPSLVESLGTGGMTIMTLPPGIAERCRSDVKQLIQVLRAEVWKREEAGGGSAKSVSPLTRPVSQPEASKAPLTASTADDQHDWLHRISTCPQGILDMLNSRSCRSAIMFNDELSLDDCRVLVGKLAACKFPFQCAHGRPSMVPLVDLGSVGVGVAVGSGRIDVGMGWDAGDGKGEGERERDFAESWARSNLRTRKADGLVGEEVGVDRGDE